MAKNINIKTIYVRDCNIEKYETLPNKADFFNWCLEKKLNEYLKLKSKEVKK